VSGIACKFGGTSLADATCIQRVKAIIDADAERRFIVPSAPGKRHTEDRKVTDLLYAWHGIALQGLDPAEPAGIIRDRFLSLAAELRVTVDIAAELEVISAQAAAHPTPDFLASRGEYLNGLLVAALLGAEFVDPAECIKFTEAGDLDLEATDFLLGERLGGSGRYVIPGFYGSLPDGSIKTFSRGGSDITGSIVARAAHAEVYENWTDVSGFLMADPRMVDKPRRIDTVTYQELRELAYMGASVLHDESIYPVREPGIPIHIKNTNDPEHPGTRIVAARENNQEPVCGIAGRAGFSMINIEKAFMNKERGFGLRVLTTLDAHGIAWEHMPTGIDTLSLIVRDEELGTLGPKVLAQLQEVCKPDQIALARGIAMIATVGQGMNHHIGVAARLCTAMAQAKVNIRVIDQGSSEMNIIIGVEEQDLSRAVRAIYEAFTSCPS